MRVKSLSLEDFRSFQSLGQLEFGAVNVFVGPNNAGKSTVLRELASLQQGDFGPTSQDVRLGTKGFVVRVELSEMQTATAWGSQSDLPSTGTVEVTYQPKPDGEWAIRRVLHTPSGRSNKEIDPLPDRAPLHFIVPFLSHRKRTQYTENVGTEQASLVRSDFANLAAKLSQLGNPTFPGYLQYTDACREILGFVVTAVSAQSGQRPGLYVSKHQILHLDEMGQGVPHIVGLLADLTLSEGKVFLVEEPENALHPSALKALLEQVIRSSMSNQLCSFFRGAKHYAGG